MQRVPKKKVHTAEVLDEKRAIIQNDTQKLLVIQREGSFTFRCIDVCYSPEVCLKSTFTPCIVHGKNAEELGLGDKMKHTLLCLLAPLLIGAYYSVGESKSVYRKNNTIPGLNSDDICMACSCPFCLIAQLRNELNEQRLESEEVKRVTAEALASGAEMTRQ